MKNQAVAYKHMDVITEMDKHPNVLNQALIINVEEILTLENYWREVLHNAPEDLSSIAKNEIKKLREILIGKTNLTHGLLQAGDEGTALSEVVAIEPIVTAPVEQKEAKVISIATGKEVTTDVTPEVFDVDTKEKVEIIQTVEQAPVVNTTETTTDLVAIPLQEVKDKTLELVTAGKKEEALAFASSYLASGTYIPREGKKVHNWKEKEINGWFKDICEKASDTESKIKVESKSEEEVKNTETTVTDTTESEEEKEKARIHKTYYGNSQGSMFEFSKMKATDEEEEAAMVELAEKLLKLKEENKTNEIEVLLNLFFLDAVVHPKGRGYNSLQKHNWWNAVQAKNAPLTNNVEFIKNATIKRVETPNELFTEGKKLIEEHNMDEKGLADWFRDQVFGRVIKGIDADFTSETNVSKWFKNMFSGLFRTKVTTENTGEMDEKRTAEIIRLLQAANPETTTIVDIVKEIKAWHTNSNVPYNLKNVHKEILELSKLHNEALHNNYKSVTADVKIKVGSKFDIKDWENTMTSTSFFKDEDLIESVKQIESVEEATNFIKKVIHEGRAGSYFTNTVDSKITTYTDDEITSWVTKHKSSPISDAVIVEDVPVVETEPAVVEPVIEEPVINEPTVEPEVTEPIVETPTETTVEETPSEQVEVVETNESEVITETVSTEPTTEESSVNEEVEVEEVSNESNSVINVAEVINAVNRKDFDGAVRSLFLEHKDKKTVRATLMSALKSSSRGNFGKYTRNISKNKEGDIHKMLNKIEDNLTTVEL